MKIFLLGCLIAHATMVIGVFLTPNRTCLRDINDARAEFAKNHHIANMNELKYERVFEKAIMGGPTNNSACSPPVLGHDHAMEVFWNLKRNDMLAVQLLSAPDRTIVACLKQHCAETGEDVVSVIVDTSMVQAINGTPGTKCSTFRTKRLNGLCALRRGYRRKFLGQMVDTFTGVVKDLGRVCTKAATGMANSVVAKFNQELQNAGANIVNRIKDVPKDFLKKHMKKIVVGGGCSIGGSVGGAIGTAVAPGFGTAAGTLAGAWLGEMIGQEIESQVSSQIDKVK
ncbi:hypothetical protein CAEBREN_09043 [Caenorhabditis brenneri]|uniref:Uncharacterized protein n=1 Tax=Caenorhabditis brenneri TaxID=135651 RepID=G0MR81_CAEBE|nr:hypothetical protein CAEBREN_09043 [Caenorhabditis brenneri]